MRLLSLALIGLVVASRGATAQSMAAEVSVTGGASTEDVRAGGTQVSVFGDLAGGLRVHA